jgi:FkbH-like protein
VKLIDALKILAEPAPEAGAPLHGYLACGFTPLHLQTFLSAELRQRTPERVVEVSTGLFGDLIGNLERARAENVDHVAAVVEWSDLDPRLGIRSLGGWRTDDVPDILETASVRARLLTAVLRGVSVSAQVAVALPTLPLPPLFSSGTAESHPDEVALRSVVAGLAADLVSEPGVRIVSSQSLDEASAPAERLDVKSELTAGFPYTLRHAAALAEHLAALLVRPSPKKGLITDLDDTLWAGLLGEIGIDEVRWSLELEAQEYGLYQQLLASFASAGVLIGVASKNEPELVEAVFGRNDLVLSRDAIFPFEVSWGSKAAAVDRILRVWNIAPDAVVFVDDSPIEVAEVQAEFPEMECIVFPTGDASAFWGFLKHLRTSFGKTEISAEDTMRLASIRSSQEIRDRERVDGGGYSDEFLASADGSVTFDVRKSPDARALELINKTNQFNLNGKRIDEPAFRRLLGDPATFMVVVSYKDRFGPLGKIASILGRQEGSTLVVTCWVMSCRAFSRRIEHHCLSFLFDTFGAETIALEYDETPRNSVFREFVLALNDASSGDGQVAVTREAFRLHAPALVHRVTEIAA